MPEENASESERLKTIEQKMSSIKDMQNIIELDIMNLKNELEKIKLVSPSPIPPEVEENIVKLEKISKEADVFKKWAQTIDEVKALRSKIMNMEKAKRPPEPEVVKKPPETSEIQDLKKQIAELRSSMLLKPGAKPPETGDLRKAIEENRRIIESMKTATPREKVVAPDLSNLKRIVEENSESIENLKSMVKTKHHTEVMPDVGELKKAIEENKKAMEDLKGRMSEATPTGSSSLDTRVTELIDMVESNKKTIEDLKVRVIKTEGKGGAGPSERVEDEIEELRELLYSKLGDMHAKTGDVRTGELKKMIVENREAMEKLKERVYAARTKKKGVEIPLPVKDRIVELEKRVNAISKKAGELGLKPIKVPEGMKLPSGGPSKVVSRKVEKLKTDVSDLLKRVKVAETYMRKFVRKEDLVSLERTLKPRMLTDKEKKMLSQDVYKDLEEMKKAISVNEDHLNSIASDVEQLKSELTTVEKREWSEVAERPRLEDLIRRLEDVERRVKAIGASSPVLIE
ncbi:MAG: hypothetical protein GTN39_05525 [Candidatus Aenigmarchaeota archaeon]|nr:hypothetical protein [Candidatus Aenigmarchaeota archaeon]